MEIYDISQPLRRGIAVWPGDPGFNHRWAARICEGAASNVSAVDMCVHTGTHVDAPLHLESAGKDVASLQLSIFVGPARVFPVAVKGCIRAADLEKLDWGDVERALFKTAACHFPENVFNRKHIYLAEDAAGFLVEKKIRLVGVDAPSVDDFDNPGLPSHRVLLRNEVAILEGIDLGRVSPGDYELICLPLRIAGADGSPVRAILRK